MTKSLHVVVSGNTEFRRKITMVNNGFWPYIEIARKLAQMRRKSCFGNQFRHVMDSFGILLEYGYTNNVLLKASIIHDIVEDGPSVGFTEFSLIENIEAEGVEVLELVYEVSRQATSFGHLEDKGVFLKRIMKHGSKNSQLLKLSDRIANLCDLAYYSIDPSFARRYINETEEYIVPYASFINPDMAEEIDELLRLNATQLIDI